jgi:hypothetical protein
MALERSPCGANFALIQLKNKQGYCEQRLDIGHFQHPSV